MTKEGLFVSAVIGVISGGLAMFAKQYGNVPIDPIFLGLGVFVGSVFAEALTRRTQ